MSTLQAGAGLAGMVLDEPMSYFRLTRTATSRVDLPSTGGVATVLRDD